MTSHSDNSKSNMFLPGCYAAIDIGTVTCRLLVVEVAENGSLSEIHRDMVICNLGAGVDETRRLASESIERVGLAIESFNDTLQRLREKSGRPIKVSAIATSASRDAENAAEFLARLRKAELDPRVISGEREAELSFLGATSVFPDENVAVVDIGGGSTEVIVGKAGDEPKFAHSFNVGCRRVTERFFQCDPPSANEINEAAGWIDSEFSGCLTKLRESGYLDGRIVAVAGTATSVVSMREKMIEYDSKRVHGSIVARAEIDARLKELSSMTLKGRVNVIGLDPGRAPVIVAGLLIMQRFMELAAVDVFTVSEFDILQGIILDSAATLAKMR